MATNTTQEIDYTKATARIEKDPIIFMLRQQVYETTQALERLRRISNSALRERMVTILFEEGLGYSPDNASKYFIRNAFPPERFSDRRRGAAENVILSDLSDIRGEGQTHTFYWSDELGGIWIKGEPERKADGFYCRITGKKII